MTETSVGQRREAIEGFRAAMDDDLNTAEAMAALFVFVNRANSLLDGPTPPLPMDLVAAREALHSMDAVLGLLSVARGGPPGRQGVESWIESLISERKAARELRIFSARTKFETNWPNVGSCSRTRRPVPAGR